LLGENLHVFRRGQGQRQFARTIDTPTRG
jgi:hypothetical protein